MAPQAGLTSLVECPAQPRMEFSNDLICRQKLGHAKGFKHALAALMSVNNQTKCQMQADVPSCTRLASSCPEAFIDPSKYAVDSWSDPTLEHHKCSTAVGCCCLLSICRAPYFSSRENKLKGQKLCCCLNIHRESLLHAVVLASRHGQFMECNTNLDRVPKQV